MNWYTPCTYQPDCTAGYAAAVFAPVGSNTRSPLRVLCRYSACSLKFVRVALPFGAHFQIASATHTRVLPLNALVTGAPVASTPTTLWSLAFAFSTDSPARQLWLR